MPPLVGLQYSVLIILVVSGGRKLLQPEAATNAMQAARLLRPRHRRIGRVFARGLGVLELVIGCWALFVGSAGAYVCGAVLFVGFNGFLAKLKAADSSAACGCFGAGSQPSNQLHRMINWGAAAVLMVGAATSSTTELSVSGLGSSTDGLAVSAALLIMVAVLAWLIAVLPGVMALGVPVSDRGEVPLVGQR